MGHTVIILKISLNTIQICLFQIFSNKSEFVLVLKLLIYNLIIHDNFLIPLLYILVLFTNNLQLILNSKIFL